MERVAPRKLPLNVAILSATNADIRAEVEAQHFRADLLFRLNTVEIHLPPCASAAKTSTVSRAFLSRTPQRYRKQVQSIDPAALQSCSIRLARNVREPRPHHRARRPHVPRGHHRSLDLGLSPGASPPGARRDESRVRGEYSHPQSLSRCNGT